MKNALIGAVVAALTVVGAATAPCTVAHAATAIPDYVTKAIADTTRPADDRKADAIRAPGETLALSGVKPGMVVGELYPCGGYFSRMLSDIVGPNGKVYGLETTRWKGCLPADEKMVAGLPLKNMSVAGAAFGEFTLPEKVDVFWITQNYHDLHIAEYGAVDMAKFNKHVFDSLKPGGVYFIVDHQANPGTAEADIAKLHRIEKAQLIREVEAAGFKLAAEGDALHRPGDDHTKSIFDDAIRGKTDQYMLKFVKP
ncbi:MAG: class I SAM-dependent methyltransferase [Alphaproteobacteria bacterium]|nr:class I SAM-dependent methyltransferase [Alphaproteobacteria bacterium]